MKNRLNNKGGDRIISVYGFAILFIVAAAVAYMVISVYGSPYDVRQLEADSLTDKMADCISYAGYIREAVLTESFAENLKQVCGVTFDVEDTYDWQSVGQFYVEVTILDFNSKNQITSFAEGNSNLKNFCTMKGNNLPVCVERKLYTIDKENKQYEVQILSIVRKTEKNAQ